MTFIHDKVGCKKAVVVEKMLAQYRRVRNVWMPLTAILTVLLVGFRFYVYWEDAAEISTAIHKWQESEVRLDTASSFMSKDERLYCHTNAIVTFVMPTQIRGTLLRAVQSILQSESCKWRLIIVHPSGNDSDDNNGINTTPVLSETVPPQLKFLPAFVHEDPRISFLKMTSPILQNYGGRLRNSAFEHIKTEWTAFLDDDDGIHTKYVGQLHTTSNQFKDAGAVLFRMLRDFEVFPPIEMESIEERQVGISFAVRTKKLFPFGRYQFYDSRIEDFLFLDELRQCGVTIIMLPYIYYMVKFSQPLHESDLKLDIKEIVIQETATPSCSNGYASDHNIMTYPSKVSFSGSVLENDVRRNSMVEVLQQIFGQGIRNGCINGNLIGKNILELQLGYGSSNYISRFIFSKALIIYHMSDVQNEEVSFTPDYVANLRSAAQVWVSVPTQYRFLTSFLGLKNVMYISPGILSIPDVSTTAAAVHHEFDCEGAVLQYFPKGKSGSRVSCIVSERVRIACSSMSLGSKSYSALPLCPQAKAAYFGPLQETSEFTHFCEFMVGHVDGFICFEILNGENIHKDVSSFVRVVTIHKFRISSLLDLQNIDLLLRNGIPIISYDSKSIPDLQAIYGKHILHMSSSEGNDGLSAKVNEVLLYNEKEYNSNSKRIKDFMTRKQYVVSSSTLVLFFFFFVFA